VQRRSPFYVVNPSLIVCGIFGVQFFSSIFFVSENGTAGRLCVDLINEKLVSLSILVVTLRIRVLLGRRILHAHVVDFLQVLAVKAGRVKVP